MQGGTWFNYDAMGDSRNRPVMMVVDLVLAVLFCWKRLVRLPSAPRKILVVRVDQIGDAVLTTPVLRGLRVRYPQAELQVLTRPASVDVFACQPAVARVHAFDVPWFRKGAAAGWGGVLRFALGLRRERFDLVVDVRPNARNVLLDALIGGYLVASPQSGLRALIHRPFLINFGESPKQHAIDRNLVCLQVLGVAAPERRLELHVDPEARARMCAGLGLSTETRRPGAAIAVIAPGNRVAEKCWAHDRWARIADWLAGQGLRVAIVGAAPDAEQFAAPIMAAMRRRDAATELCGRTSVAELIALIGLARVVVSLDSAAAHIAYAQDVPAVTMFGPMDPDVWGHRTARQRSLLAEGAEPRRHADGRLRDMPYEGPLGLSVERVQRELAALLAAT